jgi:flagellar hook-length control protein FliK
MAQIPILPQMTGGNSSTATLSESESETFSLSADGMTFSLPFDLALQQLLTPQGVEEAVQLFAMQTPVDVEDQSLSGLTLPEDGNLLPLPLQMDGKALPQINPQTLLTTEEPDSVLPPLSAALAQKTQEAAVTEAAIPKMANFVSAEKPVDLMPLISAESGDRPSLEAVRGSETSAQLPLNAVTQSAVSTRASVVLPLNTPVGQAGWDQAVGERVQWMVNQNVQQAEIKLTPPNLGPMEIRVSIQNDQTHVTFIAAQAPTREALESSIPRLREMFGEINLNLGNVDVGQHQAGEPGQEGGSETSMNGPGFESESTAYGWSADLASTGVVSGNGLLDTYA